MKILKVAYVYEKRVYAYANKVDFKVKMFMIKSKRKGKLILVLEVDLLILYYASLV